VNRIIADAKEESGGTCPDCSNTCVRARATIVLRGEEDCLLHMCKHCGFCEIWSLVPEAKDGDEDESNGTTTKSSSSDDNSVRTIRVLAKDAKYLYNSVALLRSKWTVISVPELGIERWTSMNSKVGVRGTLCSFGRVVKKFTSDLEKKGDVEFRRKLAAIARGEASFTFKLYDPTEYSQVVTLSEEMPTGIECAVLRSAEMVPKKRRTESPEIGSASLVVDADQADILASFVEMCNRDASSKNTPCIAPIATPGARVDVLWPPDGKYYPGRVVSAGEASGCIVLYETGEAECDVAVSRLRPRD